MENNHVDVTEQTIARSFASVIRQVPYHYSHRLPSVIYGLSLFCKQNFQLIRNGSAVIYPASLWNDQCSEPCWLSHGSSSAFPRLDESAHDEYQVVLPQG